MENNLGPKCQMGLKIVPPLLHQFFKSNFDSFSTFTNSNDTPISSIYFFIPPSSIYFIYAFWKGKSTYNVQFLAYKHQGLTAQNKFPKYREKEKRQENL